jgi:hypothetical protein
MVFTFVQSLSHCELITDEGIGQLGGGLCAAESLTVLELDNCPLITDTSLTHLSGCHSLRRIELYDCQLITRAGIHRMKVSSSLSPVHVALAILLHLLYSVCVSLHYIYFYLYFIQHVLAYCKQSSYRCCTFGTFYELTLSF